MHSLAPDFELLDVWRVPIEADPARGETFDDFFELLWENGTRTDHPVVRGLVKLRWLIGGALGWDRGSPPVPGTGERSIAERLTGEERRIARGLSRPTRDTEAGERVRLVYRFRDEALFEIANATIAALMHVGWIDLPSGKRSAELAVYVKSRGPLSRVYMALISPFRHIFVYPAWTSYLARLWEARRAIA